MGENVPPDPPEPDRISTASIPVPPLPNTQTSSGGGAGRILKNIALGCGGVLVVLVLLIVLIALIVPGDGGGSGESAESDSGQSAGSGATFTNENYGELIADLDANNGAQVNITGQLLGAPEISDGETYFQMFADPENVEQNTIVRYPDTDVDLKADDYVRMKGVASGAFEGENAFGAALEGVAVDAESVEVISAAEAVDPAIKTTQVNGTDNDKGFTLTLKRIEFGERTTRAYVSITNNTQAEVSFYTFDSRIVQGSSQVDVDDSFLYELPEPQSDIGPGVTTDGAIVFGPTDPNQPMRLEFEWSSYNYNITPVPLTFNVSP